MNSIISPTCLCCVTLSIVFGAAYSAAGERVNGDGSLQAYSGHAPHPNLLDGYSVRPPWKVAGVDYAVGPLELTKFKKPTKENLPPGVSIGSQALHIVGNNVTLDGYDLSGLTVMIEDDATGKITISNCRAIGVVIRSTVQATADLHIDHCDLDGGGMSSDPNFQTIKVWCSLALKYSWIWNSPGGIQGSASLSAAYNLLEGFAWAPGAHANAIYIRGTTTSTDTTIIAYNTLYSQDVRNHQGFPVGIGAAIGFFGDGGNFYNSIISNNTIISSMPGSASYLIGFYVLAEEKAVGGVIESNYLASVNGFNRRDSGAFGAFYPGSRGEVRAIYRGNVDMNTGNIIKGLGSERMKGN